MYDVVSKIMHSKQAETGTEITSMRPLVELKYLSSMKSEDENN